ncbi:MAG TPA: stalk domain-containing protein [Caldisericia bacterium]|nr:stalk domain-containing protein [Caldisericia bacterium]HPF49095.1 stalk domain-containing protein [Caldisericia bacterium]HPI83041.1 stalk domain-containing protein [Caldisericia bacterium]HPQ92268.1 stalk domain-containing protein [Caldisericia bacterium]HRV74634.1 stalk domain-containing protein [Caldisericia bacterium]
MKKLVVVCIAIALTLSLSGSVARGDDGLDRKVGTSAVSSSGTDCEGWSETGGNCRNSFSVSTDCCAANSKLKESWTLKISSKGYLGDDDDWTPSFYMFNDKIYSIEEDQLVAYSLTGKKQFSKTVSDLPLGFGSLCYDDNKDLIYIGTIEGIRCINPTNGSITWTVEVAEKTLENMIFQPEPAFYNNKAYFITDRNLFVLDPSNKKVSSLYKSSELFVGKPVISDNTILFTNYDTVYSRGTSGKVCWSPLDNSGDSYYTDPSISGDNFVTKKNYGDYKMSYDKRKTYVECYSLDDKDKIWSHKLETFVTSNLATTDEFVVYGTHKGEIFCRSTKDDDDDRNWSKKVDKLVDFVTIAGNNVIVDLYEKNGDGFSSELLLLDLETGTEKEKLTFKKGIATIQVSSYNKLVFATNDGILHCYEFVPLGDPHAIILDSDIMTLEKNDEVQLQWKVVDKDKNMLSDAVVQWSTDDETVCNVNNFGKITTLEPGECIVTGKVEGTEVEASIKVTVVDKIEPVCDDAIDIGYVDIDENETAKLTIYNGSPRTVNIKLTSEQEWMTISQRNLSIIPKGTAEVEVGIDILSATFGASLEGILTVDWIDGSKDVVVTVKTKGPTTSPDEFDLGEVEKDEVIEKKLIINNTSSTWIDIEVSSDVDWIKIPVEDITVKRKSSEKVEFTVETEGLQLGKEHIGNVVLSWRNGGQMLIPVKLTMPPDDVAPTLTIEEVEDLTNAEDVVIKCTTDEPCTISFKGEVVAEENTEFEITVPIDPAPSITDIELEATDLYGNGTKQSINIKNIKKLDVVMQIGSNVMTVDGVEKTIDPPPTVLSGSTMVPVRAVSEAFNADVQWQAETKSVIITQGESLIIVTVDSTTAIVNAETVTVSPPPQIIGGRTMLPFRFIAEALGAQVEWVAETKTIILTQYVTP